MLAARPGASNTAIAAQTGLHVDTVRKWRCRFVQHRLAGLGDRRRSGRPPSFTPVQVAEVKQLACTLPAETGVALSRWSSTDLAAEAVRRGVAISISASTIRRSLPADAIKPCRHRSWIFPRDPDFAAKAARVLDLYARCWDGEPLGPHDYVISADGISTPCGPAAHPGLASPTRPEPAGRVRVLPRRHPGLPSRLRRPPRPRDRTIAPKTGIEPFTQLVEQVMTSEPYAATTRVFWIVNNGSSHHGWRSIQRMDQPGRPRPWCTYPSTPPG